jgi:hypothetical protein
VDSLASIRSRASCSSSSVGANAWEVGTGSSRVSSAERTRADGSARGGHRGHLARLAAVPHCRSGRLWRPVGRPTQPHPPPAWPGAPAGQSRPPARAGPRGRRRQARPLRRSPARAAGAEHGQQSGAVGILRHGGPLLVEPLGGCPTPTTPQVSGGDRHLNLHGNRDNLRSESTGLGPAGQRERRAMRAW